jgi:hypothetical protein
LEATLVEDAIGTESLHAIYYMLEADGQGGVGTVFFAPEPLFLTEPHIAINLYNINVLQMQACRGGPEESAKLLDRDMQYYAVVEYLAVKVQTCAWFGVICKP